MFFEFLSAVTVPGFVDYSNRSRWWRDAVEALAVQYRRIEYDRQNAMIERPACAFFSSK